MLTITQRIERELGSASHRNADGSYCDRLVDIDIIAVDDIVVNTPTLTIPHPLMHKREFVLAPMAELAPQWIHPTLHKSVAELINEL
jgi:2-amino-4-hydroxy-6-hydroxymethyldihydropteridine diphosphokinase